VNLYTIVGLSFVAGIVLGFLVCAWRASCTTGQSMRAVILGGGPRNPIGPP
jgi:hypothetical protein